MPKDCSWLIKHGKWGTPEYHSWDSMKQRCTNRNCAEWKNYGARGIMFCDEWLSFSQFYEDMGPANGKSLGRIDNNKGYFPDNCRWETSKQQTRNKRNNVLITHNGKTQTVADWAQEVGIKAQTIYCRILAGWNPILAITKPAQPWGRT